MDTPTAIPKEPEEISMTVLGVVMQKGGVEKTTTTLSLGVELGYLGAKVLIVDMDAQSNLTQAVGLDPTR